MNRFRAVAVASVLVIALGLAASASAGPIMKHSGTIVSIAPDASTFVLAEVGPWQTEKGATVITYRTITMKPDTQFAVVTRVPEAPSGFGDDFAETRVGPDGVLLNDYVTIDCRHEGTLLMALKITVAEVPTAE